MSKYQENNNYNSYNNKKSYQNNPAPGGPATAPYNFIPLNDKIILSESEPGMYVKHNEYNENRLTGYIDLDITSENPIYIRGSHKDAHIMHNDIPSSDFFKPGGQYRIPGSSLRGMIRTLYEIVTFSKFGFYEEDKRLYYRAVADMSNLGKEYKTGLVNENNNFKYIGKSGVLVRRGRKYFIKPSLVDNNSGCMIFRINFDDCKENGQRIAIPDSAFIPIYFKPVQESDNRHFRFNKQTRRKDIPYFLRYALVKEISKQKRDGFVEGYLISSGKMNGKHMHWIITKPVGDGAGFEVPQSVIKSYKEDINRADEADLLEKLNKNLTGVPCFYLMDNYNKEIKVFGHTGLFRVPYNNILKDFVKQISIPNGRHDMAEAVFGNESEFSTRVFFEDALLADSKITDICELKKYHKILECPKPTSFQHYLVQRSDDRNRLNSYNSGTSIRGNKLYWHRNDDWTEQNPPNTKVPDEITPIKKGVVFISRIRFENLSERELGALLFILELPEGCRHKIGMGKPLGLGSVQIVPKLSISDRQNRYFDLFSEWNSEVMSIPIDSYKKTFENDMLNLLDKTHFSSLWEEDRIKELKRMLDFKRKPGKDSTRNLEIAHWDADEGKNINEYKFRKVLPKPTEVK